MYISLDVLIIDLVLICNLIEKLATIAQRINIIRKYVVKLCYELMSFN